MQLKNNVIIPDDEETAPLLPIVPQGESGVLLNVAPLGKVYIVNATPVPIASITVGGIPLATVPDGSNPGQPPQSVSVNRFGSPPLFASDTQLTVNFLGGRSYSQPIYIDSAPTDSLTLWCFYNGLVLTGATGNMKQVAWGIASHLQITG